VVFLDLKILTFILNQRILYLTNSNHPVHIFKNIPKSLFILFRLRRNNSRLFNFSYRANKLILNLSDRGYSYEILRKTARMVNYLKRDVQYKDKSNSFGLIDNKTFIF
jgi:hypothetical protein